jgi:hypothetical protein
MKKIKRGERYLNHIGEYCVIKSIYKDIIKLQICGDNARTEPWKIEDFKKHLSFSFWEIPYPKINRTNIARHLLEYQLNMIGKTTADTKRNSNWFNEWSISQQEYEFFKKYAIPLLKKTFKFNAKKAEATFEWFNLQFGLKLKK